MKEEKATKTIFTVNVVRGKNEKQVIFFMRIFNINNK